MLRRTPLRRLSSFIQRAANANDAQVLIGPFQSAGRFDLCLEEAGMECVSIGPTGVHCMLTVTESLANNFGTLHGGAVSTLVDVAGTLALLGRDPTRPGVSVEMNQSFCSGAQIGQTLSVHGTVLKYGGTLAFTEVVVRAADAGGTTKGAAGRLIATGRHTKFFLKK